MKLAFETDRQCSISPTLPPQNAYRVPPDGDV